MSRGFAYDCYLYKCRGFGFKAQNKRGSFRKNKGKPEQRVSCPSAEIAFKHRNRHYGCILR